MTSPLSPALTKTEWENTAAAYPIPNRNDYSFTVALFEGGVNVGDSWEMEGCHIPSYMRHATAALCLYDQPFGFNDFAAIGYEPGEGNIVAALREVADAIDTATGTKMIGRVHVTGPSGDATIGADYAELFRCVADRIAALLPPDPSP